MTLANLAGLLQRLGLEPGEEDMLDVLWLARFLPSTAPPPAAAEQEASSRRPPAAAGEPLRRPDRRPRATLPQAAKHSFYPRPASHPGAGPGGGQSALAVRAPAAPAIDGQLDLARALRPLTRKTPSRVHQYLDEEATARAIADEKLWVPAMKPTPTRWLELALVVDGCESMSIWRHTIAELRTVLENLGAFRDVRCWVLDQAGDTTAAVGLRRWHDDSALRSPRELIDPAGRRVILVVSDCLGPIWQSQAAQETLALWAGRGPVAIVQPLPQRLWTYSHARVARARLQALQPGATNAQLKYQLTTPGAGGQGARGIPVPVLELDAAWLASWARLLTASGESGIDAMVLFTTPPAAPARDRDDGEPGNLTARERVDRFRATASPGAIRLAEFMSAAPVTLPVIRLVQQVMLDAASQAQVAEVVLGGLLYRAGGNPDPDLVNYEFFPGVREILRRRLKRSDALRVLQEVSDYVGLRFGQARDFRALLAGADISGDFVISPDSLPFAQVATEVLRSLGGLHAETAERLAALIQGDQRSTATALQRPAGPVSAQPDRETPGSGTSPADLAEKLAGITISDRRSQHAQIVCPYCYYAFAERDILFRCAGRAIAGRPPCPRVEDTTLNREMGIHVPLPPVFRADGRKAEAVCPACHGVTTEQVCPGCHSSLPAKFAAAQGRLIALAGPSEAGKTALMGVLIHELQRDAGALLNASIAGADSGTHDRFWEYCEKPLYGESSLPRRTTTEGMNYIRPFVYRFMIERRTRFRSQSQEAILSFADSAGEDLASDEKLEFTARYLAAADAAIVLVDPLQFPRVRDRLAPGTPLPTRVNGNQDPLVAFERLTHLLRKSAGSGIIQKPVAIVVSKVDALWPLLPEDSALRARRPPLPYFDATEHVAVQEEITALLTDWGAEAINQTAQAYYARAHYFAVSALGVTPTPANQIPPPGIVPYRVTEPFTWLLSQFGLVQCL